MKKAGVRRRESAGNGRVVRRVALLASLCLLPSALCLQSSSQTETALHRWGAVTLFHGLPSDQVRAIAQDADGVMWFGTDAGLARYDGRRIQTHTGDGLWARRVSVLRADAAGVLWVGTDDGAFVRAAGETAFRQLLETKGKRITAVASASEGRAIVAADDATLFDCRVWKGAPVVNQLKARVSVPSGKAQTLELTSVAALGETVVVGTRGRGLMTVEQGGEAKEVVGRPRVFFVEALAQSSDGSLFIGAQTSAGDSGLFRAEVGQLARPSKVTGGATGTVTALAFAPGGDLFAATDGRGVFRYRGAQAVEHFTFAGTAGGLRSDRVNAVFVDREGVVWFGTPRGVCRYDPLGVRVEQLSAEADANFVRSLYRTSRGRLLAGTNRGLFARDDAAGLWRGIEEVEGRTVYAVAEDSRGLLLVGTSGGLFVGLQAEGVARRGGGTVRLTPEEKAAGGEKKGDEGGARVKDEGSTEGGEAEPSAEAAAKVDERGAGENAKPGAEDKNGAESASPPDASSKRSAEPALKGSVRAIARFGDAVYVATFGRGLERFDGPGRRAHLWPREGDDARGREVVSLYADDARGRLWIGTANAGIFYFDGRAVRAEPALAPLDRSTVWGASAADGWLWLATSRGLYAFREGRELVEIARGVDARSVAAVPSGGAKGAGLPNAWCATAGSGVMKVALDERFGPITSRLDAEQGLPTENAFAVLAPGVGAQQAASDSSLVVGTTKGLARYEPGALAPVLRITRVTASRTHQPEELRGGAFRLSYPQSGLVLDVAASASRTFPEQFQYAFTLRDERGRAIRQKLSHDSQFQIEGLLAGRYEVEARAYTLDLTPSEPLVFEFEVARAPFPRTIAALSVLLALAVVALLWGYRQHRRIVRGGEELREANRQLADARLRLANEAESERRRIARDLHDQTLADLRRLLLLTDEMQDAASSSPVAQGGVATTATMTTAVVVDPSELRAEIEAISQEVRRICEDLSPSVLENVGFAAALEWALASALAHMPPDCKFTYDFSCDEGLEERLHLAPGAQMQVYRIVQEAVSNVCRHAGATHVSLDVRVDESGGLVLKLEDDGHGFDAANRKARKGRGLAGIRARAELIEADAEWRSREGGGTVFVLRKRGAPQVRA